jgi:hypothetical protein
MTTVSVLEKLINFVYGALIFLVLVGILWAVYSIFWAEKLTIPEQNFETVFLEINELKKDTCFEVVVRPSEESHTLHLLPFDNTEQQCNKKPCLCLRETGKAWDCKIIPNTKRDCSKGVCVTGPTEVEITSDAKVNICNEKNKLFFK